MQVNTEENSSFFANYFKYANQVYPAVEMLFKQQASHC